VGVNRGGGEGGIREVEKDYGGGHSFIRGEESLEIGEGN
jgi:hypothetical protein